MPIQGIVLQIPWGAFRSHFGNRYFDHRSQREGQLNSDMDRLVLLYLAIIERREPENQLLEK